MAFRQRMPPAAGTQVSARALSQLDHRERAGRIARRSIHASFARRGRVDIAPLDLPAFFILPLIHDPKARAAVREEESRVLAASPRGIPAILESRYRGARDDPGRSNDIPALAPRRGMYADQSWRQCLDERYAVAIADKRLMFAGLKSHVDERHIPSDS